MPTPQERRFALRDAPAWRECVDFLLALRDKGGRWEVRVKPWRKKRGNDANRYYWGVIVRALAQHCGYTEGEMHDEILGAYVGWEKREVRGHVREFPRRRSTSPETMETMDFQGLILTGQQIAAELGIRLPDQAGESLNGGKYATRRK